MIKSLDNTFVVPNRISMPTPPRPTAPITQIASSTRPAIPWTATQMLEGAGLLFTGLAMLKFTKAMLRRSSKKRLPLIQPIYRSNNANLQVQTSKINLENSYWFQKFPNLKIEMNGWQESSGISEGKLPLRNSLANGLINLDFAIRQGLLFQYRLQKPENHDFQVDLTNSDQIASLPKGSFYELRRDISSNQSLGIPMPGLPPTISLSLGAHMGQRGELILKLLKLDHNKTIMVEFEHDSHASKGLRASLNHAIPLHQTLVEAGKIVEQIRLVSKNDLISAWNKETLSSSGSQQNFQNIKNTGTQMVLDLGLPDHRSLLLALLKFDFDQAQEIIETLNLDIYQSKSNESIDHQSHSITPLGASWFNWNTKDSRKTTVVNDHHQNLFKKIQEASYEREYSNIIQGAWKIKWSGISTNIGEKEEQFAFHLNWQEHNKLTRKEDIEEFLTLAHVFHLEDQNSHNDWKDIGSWQKPFSSFDDVKSKLDIILSHEGILQLKKASALQAGMAWINARIKLYPSKLMLKLNIPDSNTLEKLWRDMHETPQIRQSKHHMLNNYDFLRVLNNAKIFAQIVEKLDLAKDSRDMGEFFADLGKQKGFNFAHTIAAIAEIVDSKDLIITDMSLEGKGVKFHVSEDIAC